jgi:hypothetical protein
VILDVSFPATLTIRLAVSWNSSQHVHTIWAMYILGLCSFLRHIANMSFMVPFWASTDSGSVPIWGPRPKLRYLEKIVYSPNDSCSHFTHLFPPNVPHQHTEIISYTTQKYHSYLLYITFIRTFTSFIITRLLHTFNSSDLHGRLAALGSLCPIQG